MKSRFNGVLWIFLMVFPCTFLSSCISGDKYGTLNINLSKRTGITIESLCEKGCGVGAKKGGAFTTSS